MLDDGSDDRRRAESGTNAGEPLSVSTRIKVASLLTFVPRSVR
jgi:hypothetical protein